MRPSEFNSVLLSAAVELFAEAILDFKKRELITQNFIRQILMTAFNDDTLPGLKTAITRLFSENELIPNRSGKLSACSDVCVAVPFDMADLSTNVYLKGTFARDKEYVLINDEKSAGFSEYYSWLKLDLKVPVFSMETWAHRVVESFQNIDDIADFDAMRDLYELQEEIEEEEEKGTVERFIGMIETLINLIETDKPEVIKIKTSDTIGKLAEGLGISEEQIEEAGLDSTFEIGQQKANIAGYYRDARDVVEGKKKKRTTKRNTSNT